MNLKFCITGFLLSFFVSASAFGADLPKIEGVIKKDAVWSGTVLVAGDVLVPEGVTLTVEPGTKVMFESSESSKIEPMYLSMQTELLVRGKLLAEGTKDKPITFMAAPEEMNTKKPSRGDWGGLIFDGGGATGSVISYAVVTQADSAVTVINSSPQFKSCEFRDGNYGLSCQGNSKPGLGSCVIAGNGYGVVSGKGANAVLDKTKVEDNKVNFITRQ